jgi:hypothetical protein
MGIFPFCLILPNIWSQDLEYLAEQQPEIRNDDVSAFAGPGRDGVEKAVLVSNAASPMLASGPA